MEKETQPRAAGEAAQKPRSFADEIVAAFAQLERSERGHAAAVQLRKFLLANDGYALGLDGDNWRALETLIKACRFGGAHKIAELLPKR